METFHVCPGSTVTFTSGKALPSFVLTSVFSGSEVERLRATLQSLRPKDGVHDHLCDSHPGGPDRWEEDPGFEAYAVEWVAGVGLVTSDERVVHPPSTSWCCVQARLRQEIDAALET